VGLLSLETAARISTDSMHRSEHCALVWTKRWPGWCPARRGVRRHTKGRLHDQEGTTPAAKATYRLAKCQGAARYQRKRATQTSDRRTDCRHRPQLAGTASTPRHPGVAVRDVASAVDCFRWTSAAPVEPSATLAPRNERPTSRRWRNGREAQCRRSEIRAVQCRRVAALTHARGSVEPRWLCPSKWF